MIDGGGRPLRRLLRRVRPHAAFFALALAGFAAHAGAQVGFTELLARTVDAVRVAGDGDSVGALRWQLPLAMLAVVAFRGVGAFLGQYSLARVAQGVVHGLRTELFDHLLTLPLAYFGDSPQGHLVSRMTFTVSQVAGAASKALEVIAREGFTVLALSAWMLWMNWRLTLVFLLVAPAIALVVALASRRFRRFARRIQSAMGDVTQVAAEVVGAQREVRIFGGEARERARFARASERNRRQNLKLTATSAVSTPLIQLLVATALALLVWLVLDPALLGGMSGGDVVAFITAAGLLAKPIRQLSQVNAVLQRGIAAAQEVFAELDERPQVDAGGQVLERARGEIVFEAVRAGHAGVPVLEGIDLMVPAGRTLAIVGPSGSGKTTLASLLPRFLDVEAGAVRLDGVRLEDYSLASLRRQIAYVGQDVVLFNDSIAANIAYGAGPEMSVTPERLETVARQARVLEFARDLPDGLETMIGDDGVRLSGGQRQRLAIARALLKDAPVLILDEATSALDSASEAAVQAALEVVMRGRTTLVIAHRLSTIEHADEIVVLEAGRIVERGTHASLLAAGGAYAALQRGRREREAAGAEGNAAGVEGEGAAADVPPPAAPVSPSGSDAGPTVPVRVQPAPVAARLEGRLVDAWQERGAVSTLLAPLGAITAGIARRRRATVRRWRAPVPVIVVGNITVGGTGKTPFVLWLVEHLRAGGRSPGIVCRGHGGKSLDEARCVAPDDDPDAVGDEALLLRRRSAAPVALGRDRPAAVRALLEADPAVDVVVVDDGLQHHRLDRDLEIVLVDGFRGLGNGRCLPAGPLRESPARLEDVDLLVCKGPLTASLPVACELTFELRPRAMQPLGGGPERAPGPVDGKRRVHAIAGIADPRRFVSTLRHCGFDPILHAPGDHARIELDPAQFADDLPILLTEKDAARARIDSLDAGVLARCHVVVVDLVPGAGLVDAVDSLLAGVFGDARGVIAGQRDEQAAAAEAVVAREEGRGT